MPAGGSRRTRTVLLLVAALLVAAGLAYGTGLTEELGLGATESPAQIEPPEGLELPAPKPPVPVAAALEGGALDGGAVRGALGRLASDRRLGPRVAVAVADLDGRVVHRQGPTVVTPASTLKLLTAAAALASLGPETRFTTSVSRVGRRLVLVGGGDPMLSSRPQPDEKFPVQADLTTLARRTAQALGGPGKRRTFRLDYDATLFAPPPVNPAWEDDYVPDDVVSRIVALWVDRGRVDPDDSERSRDPAAAAAATFRRALESNGVRVKGPVTARAAPAKAERVATVRSAELVELVAHVLESSDNEVAEVLARHVGLSEGREPSFAGSTRAVREVSRDLGIRLGRASVLEDGSGLARSNKLTVRALLDVLTRGAQDAQLAGLVPGLPVAGFTGSLGVRFATDAEAGLGRVRAKTGTLTGVHGLAGLVTGKDGSVMVFVAVADRVPVPFTLFARDRLDRIAAALAGCRCARGG